MSMSIELDEKTAAAVKEIAANENRTPCEVIQDALAAYTGQRKRRLPKGAGKYCSGHTDTAAKVDEILSDAVKVGVGP